MIYQVTRDRLLKDWAYREKGITVSDKTGSGYPHDPATEVDDGDDVYS